MFIYVFWKQHAPTQQVTLFSIIADSFKGCDSEGLPCTQCW